MMTLRRRVESRLTYLWRVELIGALVWSLLVWLWWDRARLGMGTLAGLGLVVFILMQGSLYWYLKLRVVRRRRLLSKPTCVRLFKVLRTVNQIMLAISGGYYLVRTSGTIGSDLKVGIIFWVLAVLEYVNYFHRQLLYDSTTEMRHVLRNRKLKISSLARDMAAKL